MISYDELLDSLREYHLLEDEQLTEVMIELQSRYEDPQSLTEELTHRGWLTSYQAERIIRGEGKDLALGPYVLQERIGEGGMGEVYKAIHRILKSVRAIKIILPECLTSRAAIDRFYREMELVSRLKHPTLSWPMMPGSRGISITLLWSMPPGRIWPVFSVGGRCLISRLAIMSVRRQWDCSTLTKRV